MLAEVLRLRQVPPSRARTLVPQLVVIMPVAMKPVTPLKPAEIKAAEVKAAGIKPAEIKPAEVLREPTGPLADLGTKPGLLPRQRIKGLIRRRMIQAAIDIDETQVQPASLDLRLGSRAYRVPASFLPGKAKTVEAQLSELEFDEINLEAGAVLERGTVYVVELLEHLDLPESVSALANPKSSTGRLDVFTRLIADYSDVFDSVPGGYRGKIYTEISPSSFSIRVRRGSRLNQIRFRRRNPAQAESAKFTLPDRDLVERHQHMPLTDGEIALRNGLIMSVDLKGDGDLVGYRAQKFTGVIDLDSIRIPPDWAAEMVPIDPMMGEFRVHYAGFFDPGFGATENGRPGSRAVLEVRSHEVPFVLEDGQAIGRLVYEPMAETPDVLYGQTETSNYQGQGLKLSKHFRV